MKNWKRRTIGLWATVLLLIGTEAPALGGGHFWMTVEPEATTKVIPGPELLAAAIGPELPGKEAAGPEVPGMTAEPEDVEPETVAEQDAELESAEPENGEPDAVTEQDAEPEVPEMPEPEEQPESVETERTDRTVETGETGGRNGMDSMDSMDDGDTVPSDPLKTLGDNAEKRLHLFGDENWGRRQVYETEEEAAEYMVDVEVPVWTLWKGVKSEGTMTLTVHQALAEDVREIFTEIFNDPEQFPIQSMGGFRYRTGTYGEHNNGTAIDLNSDQNFQVRDGAALTGTCWEPGVNPYSFPEDGSVVRIFKAHGWSWGGDAWEETADVSTGYHDYMHFSYRGM